MTVVKKLLLTAVIFSGFVIGGCGTSVETGSIPGKAGGKPQADARSVALIAKNFEYSQSQIKIKMGEEIALKLKSDDNAHDFAVDGLGGIATVSGGSTVTRRLRIDKVGRYTFFCTLPGHRDGGMEGILVVKR